MHTSQRAAFDREIALAKGFIAAGDLDSSFGHLERAHVIGQAFVAPHARSHWLMFRIEMRRGRLAAALGQVIRIVLGAIASAVGVVPVGNTGGTDISMFRRLPISPELQAIIDGRTDPTAQGPRD